MRLWLPWLKRKDDKIFLECQACKGRLYVAIKVFPSEKWSACKLNSEKEVGEFITIHMLHER